jgi:riboflavin synthase
MFTGIVTDIGRVRSLEQRGDARLVLETGYDMTSVDIGASISCSGACLTVVEKGEGWFAVDASAETMARTVLGEWQAGSPVNLERAMKVGDEFGGHIVSGHVDGVGQVVDRRQDGDSVRFTFELPPELARFVAEKGSVCLNGVSLTVNEVNGTRFGVNIIPHTLTHTTFGETHIGARVNVEIDMLARYVARLTETRGLA